MQTVTSTFPDSGSASNAGLALEVSTLEDMQRVAAHLLFTVRRGREMSDYSCGS